MPDSFAVHKEAACQRQALETGHGHELVQCRARESDAARDVEGVESSGTSGHVAESICIKEAAAAKRESGECAHACDAFGCCSGKQAAACEAELLQLGQRLQACQCLQGTVCNDHHKWSVR